MIKLALAAAVVGLPLAAGAAELPLAKIHKRHVARHHSHVWHGHRVHFGYYWYNWGWRSGGTRRCWCGSTFTFVDSWD